MDLLLATRNPHKTREFRELLGAQFRVEDLNSFPEIGVVDETGRTFAENAILKAVTISTQLPGLVIADDSGIEVDALGGAPGIYSARFAGENATDTDNIQKLLGKLRSKEIPEDKRTARFRCVIALAQDGKFLGTFEGIVEGQITDARGKNGFGYDPIFQPTGFTQTFAEMGAALKNRMSHRAKATAGLREALRENEN